MLFQSIIEAVVRLGAAIVCGSLLGWEREVQRKPAGLRTHMMVSLGSATFTLLLLLVVRHADETGTQSMDALKGVIAGIGFLGAGTIIQARGSIHGLTTATTMWVSGAAGMACGLGEYLVAVIAVGFASIVLVGIGYVEHKLLRDDDSDNELPVVPH